MELKCTANSEADISKNVNQLTILLNSKDFNRPGYK